MVIKKQKANPKAGPKKNRAHNSTGNKPAPFEHECHIGTPNPECACCRGAFGTTRRRATQVRIVPREPALPIGAFQFAYDICGGCLRQATLTTAGREAVLRQVIAYHAGVDVEVANG